MFASLIALWTGTDDRHAIAESVAGLSAEAVWNRVSRRLPSLSINEARGYVRIRALPIIEERIRIATESVDVTDSARASLIELASEKVVRAMLHRLAHGVVRHALFQRAA